MSKFLDLFKKSRISNRISPDDSIAYQRYSSFKRLLTSNNRSLEIIANLENIIYQDKPITFPYALRKSEELISEVFTIVESLNSLASAKYLELFDAAGGIGDTILAELKKKKNLMKQVLFLNSKG